MKTKIKYGLIGHPIEHSLSPALFRAGFDGSYDYELIEGCDFENSFKSFIDSYEGINVTAPFKEKACSKADILSPECEVIGACNVLKKTKDGILAANTDYLGIIKCIIPYQEAGTVKATTLVVGCGGAGKAAAYAARMLGNDVIILNRNVSKAEEYAAHLRSKTIGRSSVTVSSLTNLCKFFKEAGTIIYTLPLSIPQIKEIKTSDLKGGIFSKHSKVILEANYLNASFSNEMITRFKEINPKISYISGKEWLLYQAVEAYQIFTGKEPNIQKMITVL